MKRRRKKRRNKNTIPPEVLYIGIGVVGTFVFIGNMHTYLQFSFFEKLISNFFGTIFASLVFLIVSVCIVWVMVKFAKGVLFFRYEYVRYKGLSEVEHIDTMDHYEFEDFVGYVLRHNGFSDVTVTKRSGDGGIDLKGRRGNKHLYVQVKHYKKGNSVGIEEVQRMVGVYQHEVDEGWFVTTSDYTIAAKNYAKDHPTLHLVNRVEFGNMMRNLPGNTKPDV
jgi:restriction system protein